MTMSEPSDESQLLDRLTDYLTSFDTLLPVISLTSLFHAANHAIRHNGLRDRAEARNVRVLSSVMPITELRFAGTFLKPADFIHPFEDWYTLPGYLDQIVLPHFCNAVDQIADELAKGQCSFPGETFLSFVYTFFLLVHPLAEGNGRVARRLMEYYNRKLDLKVLPIWRNVVGQIRFSHRPFHRTAFEAFFLKEAKVPRLTQFGQYDPFPIPQALKPHLGMMADYMIYWAESSRRGHLGHPDHVRIMSTGLGATG
jgi:hypothetical protein